MLTSTKLMKNVGISRISRQIFENFSTSSVYRSEELSNHHDSDDNNPETPFEFTDANLQRIVNLIKNYPSGHERAALIPSMDIAQRQYGWLPISAMHRVADMLCIPRMRVYEVASFYTMFKRRYRGKYHVKVCGTTPCWLRGAEEIMEAAISATGSPEGGLSPDGMFGVDTVECAGACANAPVLVVDDDYYEDVTPYDVCQIIECIKSGGIPPAGPRNGRGSCEPICGLTSLVTPPPPPGSWLQPALSGGPSAPPKPKTPPTPPHAPKPPSGGSPIKPRSKPSGRTRICGGAIPGPCRPKEPTTSKSLVAPQMRAGDPLSLPTPKQFYPPRFDKYGPYPKYQDPKSGAFSSPTTDQKKTETIKMFTKPVQSIDTSPDISHLKNKKLILPYGPTELKLPKPAEKTIKVESSDKPNSPVSTKKITSLETGTHMKYTIKTENIYKKMSELDDVIPSHSIVRPKEKEQTLKSESITKPKSTISALSAIKKLFTGPSAKKSESASLTKTETGIKLSIKPEKIRSEAVTLSKPAIKSAFKEPVESPLKSKTTAFEIKGPWKQSTIQSKSETMSPKMSDLEVVISTKPKVKRDSNELTKDSPKKPEPQTTESALSAIKKLFSGVPKESPSDDSSKRTLKSALKEKIDQSSLKPEATTFEIKGPWKQSPVKPKPEKILTKHDVIISTKTDIKPEILEQGKDVPKTSEPKTKNSTLSAIKKLFSSVTKEPMREVKFKPPSARSTFLEQMKQSAYRSETKEFEIKDTKKQMPNKPEKDDVPKMSRMDIDKPPEPMAKPETRSEASPKISEFETKSPLSAIKKIFSFPTKESPPDAPPKPIERSTFLDQMKQGALKSQPISFEEKQPKEHSQIKSKLENISPKMTKLDVEVSTKTSEKLDTSNKCKEKLKQPRPETKGSPLNAIKKLFSPSVSEPFTSEIESLDKSLKDTTLSPKIQIKPDTEKKVTQSPTKSQYDKSPPKMSGFYADILRKRTEEYGIRQNVESEIKSEQEKIPSNNMSKQDVALSSKPTVKPAIKKSIEQTPVKSESEKMSPKLTKPDDPLKQPEIKKHTENSPVKSDSDTSTLKMSKLEAVISTKPTVKPEIWEEIEQSPIKESEKLSPIITKPDALSITPTAEPIIKKKLEKSSIDPKSEKTSPIILKPDVIVLSKPTAAPEIKIEQSSIKSGTEKTSPKIFKPVIAVSSKAAEKPEIKGQSSIKSETEGTSLKWLKSDAVVSSKPFVEPEIKQQIKQSPVKSEPKLIPLKWLKSNPVIPPSGFEIPGINDHTERSFINPTPKFTESDYILSKPTMKPEIVNQTEHILIKPEETAASLITLKKIFTGTPAKKLAPRKTKIDRKKTGMPDQMLQIMSDTSNNSLKPKSILKPEIEKQRKDTQIIPEPEKTGSALSAIKKIFSSAEPTGKLISVTKPQEDSSGSYLKPTADFETKEQRKDRQIIPEPETTGSALSALKKIFSSSANSTGKLIPVTQPQGKSSESYLKPTAHLETKEQNEQSPFKYDSETSAALKTISKLFSATPSEVSDLTEAETTIKQAPTSGTASRGSVEVSSPKLVIKSEKMEKGEPEKPKIKISKVKKLSDAGKESSQVIDTDTDILKKTKIAADIKKEKSRPSDEPKAEMDSPTISFMSPSTETLPTSSTPTKSMDTDSDPLNKKTMAKLSETPSPLTNWPLETQKESTDTSKNKDDKKTTMAKSKDRKLFKVDYVSHEHKKIDLPPPILLEPPRVATTPSQEKDKEKNEELDPKKK